jgi:hypothetical protein
MIRSRYSAVTKSPASDATGSPGAACIKKNVMHRIITNEIGIWKIRAIKKFINIF